MLAEETDLKSQTDFATIYSCLFSLSVSVECLQAMYGLLSERGHKHARNRVKIAEEACSKSYNQIEKAITNGLGKESKEIMLNSVEVQKDILYKFFLLDPDQQEIVRCLINKLNKEV